MIPHEPDIKVKKVTASLEVPQPPDPVAPNPLVFVQPMPQVVGVMLVGITFLSVIVGILTGIAVRQAWPFLYKDVSIFAGLTAGAAVFVPLVRQIMRNNQTQARIELVGSTISEFNKKGELYVEGSLREIEGLVEKHAYRGPVRYYVFFKDGKVISFNSEIGQDFRLRKILQNWSGKKFEEVDMFAPNPTLDQIDSRYPAKIL